MLKINFIGFLLSAIVVNAQNVNPGDDALFRELEITEIRITMTPEDKTFLLAEENRYEETYVPATVHISNSQLDNVEITGTGVRLRGNTSRGHDKRGYKIDFREFGGSKFNDYKKINLKPNVNDPTVVRELLAMHLYRAMGVTAARITPATLYLNDEYMGTYLIMEQTDDEYLDDRFGHEDGFLYKCGYGANLTSTCDIYDNGLFETEINEEEDTRAELAAFRQVLNQTPSETFATTIEAVFEVDKYLRQLAVEAVLGHWDGYSINQNNFYLYYNGQTQKFEFFPYDTDNTFGIDWINGDWAQHDLSTFYVSDRPLTTRILDVPEFRNQYMVYVAEFFEKYFNLEYLQPLFDHYKTLLSEAVESDTYFDNSFGFTHTFFLNSFDQSKAGHVEYGLKGYVQTRREQLILGADAQQRVSIYPNPANSNRFWISATSVQPTVQVLNMEGKQQSSRVTALSDTQFEVEISPEAKGLFLIVVDGAVIKWMKH